MAPRVLIDATAVPADRGGLGRYVDGLLAALGALGADVAVVCQRVDAERYGRMLPNAQIVAGPASLANRTARLAWEQTGLPLIAEHVGARVLHTPNYSVPLHSPVPVVTTIHDATFFSEPELYPAARGAFYRAAIRSAVRRASRCIVPSKATREELVRLLEADPTRIDVAYHGVDHAIFHPPSDAERAHIFARLGLRDQQYVAFLGAFEPRKNVPSLVRGWVQAVKDMEKPPALVIAGGAGWDDDIDAAIAEVPAHLRVIRPGYLRIADLAGYLGSAEVVAFPSHGEGFGLPVLEAMACGAAVLTTYRLSLPEVGGDAVAYTEPDAVSIGRALAALLADPDRRRALGEAAYRRSLEFSWTASAEAHLASYERAAGEA
ncbi:glycosyl transferase, group 1 [Acidothermus cellulolyticus 11B]|uniref:Glycosyl transferase, group 1 n=1 Tax=Acidothermus cellulolyticus (strain ATCC 43068 / DSM 8971 / 11B) TaxID=351607 RepID=A0LRZ1_ACIC1|nr:glycosyltransferase family 1 protein [Acidothermus cellulolyticus]ABK52201.1 glycosyl transferase, group 1 [Acidothermus cellulolyticus 11B]MCL6551148.1 glycosyltransferase family 4 protein [Acidothermus cellulolyticus]